MGNTMAGIHSMGVRAGSHAATSRKRQKKEGPMTRCQGLARKQSNNDDDDYLAYNQLNLSFNTM